MALYAQGATIERADIRLNEELLKPFSYSDSSYITIDIERDSEDGGHFDVDFSIGGYFMYLVGGRGDHDAGDLGEDTHQADGAAAISPCN
jgi:hypothetical protein